MRRIADTTLGNPLFALEIGRALAARGAAGGEIPLPDAVEDLLGIRVAALPDAQRRALLAVALGGDLRPDELSAVADAEDALDAGLLRAEAGARPPDPPAARRGGAQARALARAPRAPPARSRARWPARSGAPATSRWRRDNRTAGLADTVATAADGAAARGAAAEAVELAEHALRLTPAERPERVERLLALAHQLETAGERRRVTELLTPELEGLPPGGPRVRAWLLLANGSAVADLPRPPGALRARPGRGRRGPGAARARAGLDGAQHGRRGRRADRRGRGVGAGGARGRRRAAGRAARPARAGLGAQPERPPDRRRLRALRAASPGAVQLSTRRSRSPPCGSSGAGTWSGRARR